MLLLPNPVLLSSAVSFDGSAFPGDSVLLPGGDGAHDPAVIHFGSKYFCFTTSGNGFGPFRESKDMRSWTMVGPLLPNFPDWLTKRFNHRSVWAPNMIRHGADLRIYYCMSNWGTNDSVIGLLECHNFDPGRPLLGWQDLGEVFGSKPGKDTFNAIDPEVVTDQSGNDWMFFGSYFAGLYVMPLDKVTGKPKDTANPGLTLVAKNTEERGNPLEASAVCYRSGYYYLFTSYGLAAQGVRSTYRIMVGRSAAITGPFLDADGTAMVDGGHVSVLNTSSPMFGPGHCHVFQDTDSRWLMPYHYYDSRRYWTGDKWGLPTLQIRELLWSPDGWPMPGLPVGFEPKPQSASPAGHWVFQFNFGLVMNADLKADGTFNTEEGSRGTWRKEGESIELDGFDFGRHLVEPKLTFQMAYRGAYMVGRNPFHFVVRAFKQRG